jgi:hypothetical protein
LYQITTVNGYTATIDYILIKAGELPNRFIGKLKATQDAKAVENGYISLSLEAD